MIVLKSQRIDLARPARTVVHCMQTDNTQKIDVSLFVNNRPYDVTADVASGETVTMAVAYILPNGFGDQYAVTALGEPAVEQDDTVKHIYHVMIDGVCTAVEGFVQIIVKFTTDAGQILNSFPLTLDVIKSQPDDVDPDGTPAAQSRYVRADRQTPATEEMTEPVGITPEGLLVTTPGGGGGSGTVNPVGMGFAYSTASTAQATATKTTGTVSGFALKQYAIVVVRFSNPVNSGQKLNFSGTGAKDIYFRNSAIGPGIIEAGDTVTFQYDGNRYRIISIDKAPVSQTDDSNYFIHLTASPGGGGDMLTDRTASDIYTALSANTDLNFILIDGNGRQANFTKKPTSVNDSAQFTLVANGNQITYTLPTNGGNTVTITTESIIGGGGTATWESILPDGGIRQTDIAKLTVTFTPQGNGYTASSNLTQVLAALNDNKAVECRLGDHIGGLVYAHQDAQDTSADFAIFKFDGMIVTYQGQEGEERYPQITTFYMTHVGVTYQETAIGGTCYCYVTANNGVYDIDTESTSLTAQTIVGLLSAFYAGVETRMIVYDGYQRWSHPVIAHYGSAEIVFGGVEQVVNNGVTNNYLVSYTLSTHNSHVLRFQSSIPIIPVPTAQQIGYIPVANGQGGFTLTLPEAAAGADGISPALKNALSNFAHAVGAFNVPTGAALVDALDAALWPDTPVTPTVELVSISAVFTQGQTAVYPTTSLDSLKSMLVVTATYDDTSTATIADYTLSGTLSAGTSTVTVSYGGKTTTFTVAVSATEIERTFSATGQKFTNKFHFALLVENDNINENDAIVVKISGTNWSTTPIAASSANSQRYFGDNSGEVGNSSYSVSGPQDKNITVSQENGGYTLTRSFAFGAAINTDYIKFVIPIDNNTPFSFDIGEVSVTVNGTPRTVLKFGSFFTEETYTIVETEGE